MTVIIYSAYNAALSRLADDAEAEDAWYARLRVEPRIGGLELAVSRDGLHPKGFGRLIQLLDPQWSNTISAMSMTLDAVAADCSYGLASKDAAGRARAVDDIDRARTATLQLRECLGASAVRGFTIQSAPRADRSSTAAFVDSLARITAWDWQGVELLVEHSDALVKGQNPQKGYLSLTDEVAAVSALSSNAGCIRLLLNWARSVIEGHDVGTPAEHVGFAGETLGAFTFSGVSPHATGHGVAWEDVHLGLAEQDPASLLDAGVVRSILGILPSELSYIGVKTGAPVNSLGTERLSLGLALLDVLA